MASSFPSDDVFFLESADWTPRAIACDTDLVNETVAGNYDCRHCGQCVSSLHFVPPITIDCQFRGGKVADFVMHAGENLFVTPTFVGVWTRLGGTGLDGFYPTIIRKVRGRLPPNTNPTYHYAILKRAEHIFVDEKASGLKRQRDKHCPYCASEGLRRCDRLILRPFDGPMPDLFEAANLPGDILASRRFVETMRSAGVTGFFAFPAREYSFDLYPWDRRGRKN